MTQKLTAEETKKLLDSLFALPDKAAKTAKPATPKAAKVKADPEKPVHRRAGFTPVAAIIEVVNQNCTTCGAQHSYVRSRRVRFESKTEMHEFPVIVPEKLPRRVDHVWEDTNVCPTCLAMSSNIDDILALAEGGMQLELFHG